MENERDPVEETERRENPIEEIVVEGEETVVKND